MFDFRAAIKEAAIFSARLSLDIIQFVSPAALAVSTYGGPTDCRPHRSAVASNCYEMHQIILCFLKKQKQIVIYCTDRHYSNKSFEKVKLFVFFSFFHKFLNFERPSEDISVY